MPDCTICLINFTPDDDIIVFSCNERHYFHEKCAVEWLEVKTECPLCRFEFAEEIHKHLQKSDDIIDDVARQAAHENSQQEIENSGNDELGAE